MFWKKDSYRRRDRFAWVFMLLLIAGIGALVWWICSLFLGGLLEANAKGSISDWENEVAKFSIKIGYAVLVSACLSLLSGLLWWGISYVKTINGPADIRNMRIFWLLIMGSGCLAVAAYFFSISRGYDSYLKLEVLVGIGLIPVATYAVSFWLGTGLWSPATLISSVVMFPQGLRKVRIK
jgi:hypothetical protein